MSVYVGNIMTAVAAFPLIAFFITVPVAIVEYNKAGALHWFRLFMVFSFVFYLLCAYFLVLLPLPEDLSIVVPGAEHPRLVPFNSFKGLIPVFQSDLGLLEKTRAIITHPCIYEYLFNILLLLPLGAYLHYYFRLSIPKTVLVGFLVSLSFETLQYTGLLGIYDHPYRYADVDDLIANTLGAYIGALLSQRVKGSLPDMAKIDESTHARGRRASLTRRVLSFIVDLSIGRVILVLIALAIGPEAVNDPEFFLNTAPLRNPFMFAALFALVPLITKGQTLGQKALGVYTARLDASRAPWHLVAARYYLLWLFANIPGFVFGRILRVALDPPSDNFIFTFMNEHVAAIVLAGLILIVLWALHFLWRAIKAKKQDKSMVTLYGLVSRTRVLTVQAEEEAAAAAAAAAEQAVVAALAAAPAGNEDAGAGDKDEAVHEGEVD